MVHTSGSVSINDLKNDSRKGVFYMLKIFSKDKKVKFSEVPFCIETMNKEDSDRLKILASYMGSTIMR